MNPITTTIIILGVFFSTFYGLFAVQIFMHNKKKEKFTLFNDEGKHTVGWYIHQIWINFVATAIGWGCVYILYSDLTSLGTVVPSGKNLTFAHLIIFLIGSLGVMGFLPNTILGIGWSFRSLAEKIINKL